MRPDRREFIAAGTALLGALAGCGTSERTTTPADEADDTATPTPTPTSGSGSEGSGDGGVPGADAIGGPDDLQSSASVRAATLSEDQGAGQFVFTPAVVWLESGGTIEWAIEGASHSVTAYHPDNDKPLRVPEDAAAFDSETLPAGESFEHTFETPGVYNYYCIPHEGLGMVGVVVVDGPGGGPGMQPISEVSGTAATNLERQLTEVAGLSLGGEDQETSAYGWEAATWDSYWYSLYNMFNTIALSGNGVTFPTNEDQKETFKQRMQAILGNSAVDQPPVKNPNLNMAPFTEGDPSFTEQPDYGGQGGRPDASTLGWASGSAVVSPASLGWTHLKGVTWAKNFQNHFDVLPESQAARFKAQQLATIAQIGTKFALVDGRLRANEENMLLVSGWSPGQGVVAEGPDLRQHTAMLWFMSNLVSLAQGGWFGYENPEPLIPATNLQKLTDGLGKTVMNAFAPSKLSGASTRDLGALLGGVGWYGTHAGSDKLATMATDYATGVADLVADQVDANGRVAGGAPNQAATQGVVGQGLLWASQIDGVDRTDTAESVLGYLLDELWDGDAGTFAPGTDAATYTITARDAGDITGGLNAADAVLGMGGVKETFAAFFDNTMNRGRLQRAEMPPSRDPEAEHTLPLPPKAGGEFGQAPMYNRELEYDPGADEWSVTDDTFDAEAGMYLSNQDVWVGQWGGNFYQGRGVPGETDSPK